MMFKVIFGRRGFLYLFILTAFFSCCAQMKYFPSGNVQTGIASWYGPEFHGKPTSNKEIYNMYDMTAAHNTLPFGTCVMVTNLDNGKSVTVRINDRGPFMKGRVIDLSYAAAQVIDMIGPGVVPVKIEVLPDISPPKSSQKFSVQVGSFIEKDNAEELKKELRKNHKNVYISIFNTQNQRYYRVRIKARSLKEAETIAQRLSEEGYTVLVLEEQ